MQNRGLLLALFLFLTVGCNDNELVAGRKLVLESHEGAPPLAGAKLTLSFADGGLNAYAGCNHMNGAFRIRGGTLEIENFSTTLMLCEPAVDAEDWFQAFLSQRPSIELLPSRAVVMKRGAARLVFVDEKALEPVAPAQLPGRTFKLASHVGAAQLADLPLRLSFTADSLAVSGGCDKTRGSYRIAQGALLVEGVTSVIGDCECALEGEAWFETFLGQKPAIELVRASEFVLANGEARLVFVEERQPKAQP
jgi:heat shock protein HslJ